jgi:hypothetical protein
VRSQSTMDWSNGAVVGSPALMLGAALVSGTSPRVGEKGEELQGVLTEGTKRATRWGNRPGDGEW